MVKIIKEKILKNSFNHRKYLVVHLSKDGKSKVVTLHRLVAEAFIPNPENKPEVNHIDEDGDMVYMKFSYGTPDWTTLNTKRSQHH